MKYAGVIPNDTVDVDKGLSVSFWVQGCPHHCPGCHNPETWDKDGGYELPTYLPLNVEGLQLLLHGYIISLKKVTRIMIHVGT